MKARLVSVFLCIIAFVLSMLMLLKLIENPLNNIPDIMDTPTSENTEGTTPEPDSSLATDVTSMEGVMALAKETGAFFETLAYGADKSATAMSDLLIKWKNAAVYLTDSAEDAAGGAYYNALYTSLRDFTAQLPESPAAFSAAAGAVLRTVEGAKVQATEETQKRYPSLDTSENGTLALSLLSLFSAAQKSADTLRVSFGGEVAMGDFIGSSLYQSKYTAEGANNPLAGISPVFATDDLSIVSLTAPLTAYTVPEVAASEAFRGSAAQAYAAFLKDAGVDVVSLATCRITDFGKTGYDDTVNALTSVGITVSEADTCTYLESPVGKVAVISFDLGGKDNTPFTEIPRAMISEAREAGATIVITYFHMDTATMTANKANTLRAAADAGADLVLSSHNESYQGILTRGEDRTALVVSPGALSNAALDVKARDAFLFTQSFSVSSQGVTPKPITLYAVSTGKNADAPFEPTLGLDAGSVSSLSSAMAAALVNYDGRATETDLTYALITK